MSYGLPVFNFILLCSYVALFIFKVKEDEPLSESSSSSSSANRQHKLLMRTQEEGEDALAPRGNIVFATGILSLLAVPVFNEVGSVCTLRVCGCGCVFFLFKKVVG